MISSSEASTAQSCRTIDTGCAQSGTPATQRRHTFLRHDQNMDGLAQTENSDRARHAGTSARCAVCSSGSGVRPFFLTHGVRIDLCRVHRDGEFLRRRGGHALTVKLEAFWRRRHGTVSARQALAARTHRLRVRGKLASDGPGSYSWSRIRFAAEARFADGEDPTRVIAELRDDNLGGNADVPSERTMRRWFFEGRWLVDPRVWIQRMSRRVKRWDRDRPVQVTASALGMCIFQPGLALAKDIALSDAVRDAVTSSRQHMARVRKRLIS